MPNNTVRFHRVLRAPAERIYRAFLDPGAMAKWLPPFGFTCHVEHMTPEVGGSFRMAFTQFSTGHSHAFGGIYQELLPSSCLRYSSLFDDPHLPGEMLTTVTLTEVSCGTEVNIVQEGIPVVIPLEACHLGWQESLVQLAQLVEGHSPG